MAQNINYKRGTIVSAFCRFSKEIDSEDDSQNGKYRPAVILKSCEYDVIVAEITKSIRNLNSEVILQNDDLSAGSLPFKSCVRIDKIQTVSKENISFIGKLRHKKFAEISRKVKEFLFESDDYDDGLSNQSPVFQRPPKK